MIAKITKRGDFSGIVNYQVNDKKQAKIIDSNGVRIGDVNDIVASFEMQLSLKPNIKNPVYHIALNFSKEDLHVLSDEKMAEIARDYMKSMGITNTQYIAVRHFDKEHPHIHLCINRVDNDGNLISDQHDLSRSVKVCKEITHRFGLHFGENKNKVNRDRLKGADKVRYEIYDSLTNNISYSKDWNELKERLHKEGIDVTFKYKGNTTDIQGVVFSKNGYQFSGSKVDKSFSYSKISKEIGDNDMSIEIHNQNSNEIIESKSVKYNSKNTIQEMLSHMPTNFCEESGSNSNKKRKRFKR